MSFSIDLDLSLLSSNLSVEEHLMESAAKIAFNNFQWRFITLLFFNTTLLYGAEHFLKIYNKSVIVGHGECDTPFAQHTKQRVLVGTDNNNIELILSWMQKREFDNTGKHIIICLSDYKEDCDESEAMRIFWHFKVINVVFMRRAFNERDIIGYTYQPLGDSRCDAGLPVRLNNLDNCDVITNEANCKMYPEKIRKLHGCTLTVTTFEQPPYMYLKTKPKVTGSEGDLLWLLQEGLNATFKIMTPQRSDGWGIRMPDGSWVGALGDVYDDAANFSLTSSMITYSRFQHFDMSIYYNFVHIGWVTCQAQLEPSLLKLLHPFGKFTGIAITTTYIFVIAAALFTKTKLWAKFSSQTNMDRPRNSVIFYSWMICMGSPTPKLPKKRILLVMVYIWVWYTFLIRTVYQAALINSLKRTVYLSNYDTLEAAIDDGFQFGGPMSVREYYADHPTIFNQWTDLDISEMDSTMVKLSEGFKFVQALNLEFVDTFHQRIKKRKIHVLPQKIVVSPTVMYFKKFSPLVKTFNRVLRWLVETGFTIKLYDDYANFAISKDTETNKPLTLEHFKGCYVILFTGWIVSFVILLCESVFSQLKHKQYY